MFELENSLEDFYLSMRLRLPGDGSCRRRQTVIVLRRGSLQILVFIETLLGKMRRRKMMLGRRKVRGEMMTGLGRVGEVLSVR